ncbi:ATP-binding protein [Rhodopseudomonas sp. HC1]|uniref:sensor histidine kinase n=1 Tax=Rhodopseudomonas infernalis TaxID=2897386 RepID=UPI001EE7C4C4|nr:ATP-binding protein [Rhodopseudomonas infernalis]MCG6205808.1 ATP-binding protein [Rhodopseudomonas infernalis]
MPDRTATGEEKYRSLIQHLPTALWQVDSRRTGAVMDLIRVEGVRDIAAFLDANPDFVENAKDTVVVSEVNIAAVALFRAKRPNDLIRPVRYLFEADPDLAKRVMVAHYNGERNLIEETRMLAFDGTVIDVRFSVTFPRPPEQLDTTFISIQDISPRLNTERQLRKLQADFARAARIATLGELATSIAHEISQPLTAIVSNGEASLRWLARGDHDCEKVAQLTSKIVTNARRASDIIQRMRGMAAKHELERHPLDLNDAVQEAMMFIGHDVESKTIVLTTAFDAGRPTVVADRVQLQQVVINLLINSVQALVRRGGECGRIEVRTSRDGGGFASISVGDNGPGIAEADLERVFDSFFSTKESGLGVGLAICQTIVAAHGGEIRAANRPQGGAQFVFTVPLADPGLDQAS